MKEVLDYYANGISNSKILDKLGIDKKRYFVVSTHREENVDNKDILKNILTLLNELANKYDFPVIVSTHPRTREKMEQIDTSCMHDKISFLKPFGFLDYVFLQKNAKCVLSDSGTISEESAILNFPAVSIRNSMERPEAQDCGTIVLTGFDKGIVLQSIEASIDEIKHRQENDIPSEYLIKNTSWRVLKLILGTARLSNKWAGINTAI